MSYARLVEPGIVPDGQVAFHVAEGTEPEGVAQAAYPVLRAHHDEAELVVSGRPVGVMTMPRLLPVLLTLGHVVRGRTGGSGREPGTGGGTAAPVRCPVCGATAYVLGDQPVDCREPGHGRMVPGR